MKKILFFAGSNSSKSINHKLVNFASSQFAGQTVEVIKLVDYELPMFSEDIEREKGYSVDLKMLYRNLKILYIYNKIKINLLNQTIKQSLGKKKMIGLVKMKK